MIQSRIILLEKYTGILVGLKLLQAPNSIVKSFSSLSWLIQPEN